jgi:metal-responsive CopG/Arc/MetJ family transcriptional regulator
MAKFSITLPDKVAMALERWADEEGRNRGNLVAFLLELAIRQKYPDEFPPRGTRKPD